MQARTRSPRRLLLQLLTLAAVLGWNRSSAQCMSWGTQFSGVLGQETYALATFDDGSGSALYQGDWGVKRWNGSAWTTLSGLTGSVGQYVGAFGVYDDGTGASLYAGGEFDSPSQGIARWNGSTWVAMPGGGLGFLGSYLWVYAMTVFDDGSGPALFIGGSFDYAFNGMTSVVSHGIIKWNGSRWSGLAGGISGSLWSGPYVRALAVYDDGTGPALYASGNFSSMGGVPADGLARWNGASWSTVPGAPAHGGSAMAVFDDGTGPALFLGGVFTSVGGTPANCLAKWNGTAWTAVPGSVMNGVMALTVFDDGAGAALYVAGSTLFPYLGNVARWDGTRWFELGQGVNNIVRTMSVYDDGAGGGPDLYLGGDFYQAGDGVLSQRIAEWHGCQGQVVPMCPGDGTFAACPCHNSGSAGHGCQNSTGLGGALLNSSGTTIPDTFTLTSQFEPSTALTVFVLGDALNTATIAFGDGIRCAGGHVLRMYARTASAGAASAPITGEPPISVRSANLGHPIFPGTLRYFQAYYRDGVQTYCPPNNFNVTNALRVIW